MELNFERIDNLYVAEFEVASDFNLHIERDTEGRLDIYQRTAGGQYEYINDIGWLNRRLVYDYDFTALVYPKYIKIVTSVLPLVATITTDGEVNELKYQEKSVEITSNGTTKVTPDAGYNGLALVNVKVNVEGGSGGGSTDDKELKRNDVNFFDYDGTLLYAYTWEKALELTELPEGPKHEGLVFQEWNYSLEDIWEQGSDYIISDNYSVLKVGTIDINGTIYYLYSDNIIEEANHGFVTTKDILYEGDHVYYARIDNYGWVIETDDNGSNCLYEVSHVGKVKGCADVGANYTTHDGKTRYYLNVLIPNQTVSFKMRTFSYPDLCNVSINWGDGTSEQCEPFSYDADEITHTFRQVGQYCIEVESSEYISIILHDDLLSLEKIEYGDHILDFYLWGTPQYLPELVSIPKTLVLYNEFSQWEAYCPKTKCIVLPRNLQSARCFNMMRENAVLSLSNSNLTVYGFNLHINTDKLVLPKKYHLDNSGYMNIGGNIDTLIVNSIVADMGIDSRQTIRKLIINSPYIELNYNGTCLNYVKLSPLCNEFAYWNYSIKLLDATDCLFPPTVPSNSFNYGYIEQVKINAKDMIAYRDATNWGDISVSSIIDDSVRYLINESVFIFKINNYPGYAIPGLTWKQMVDNYNLHVGWYLDYPVTYSGDKVYMHDKIINANSNDVIENKNYELLDV